MGYQHITVEPLSGALGAEISGVDIAAPIDQATFDEIRKAWNNHLVVFFRDQPLDDAALMTFGKRFAPL
ncbi:MAG: TauD/TfdA family dioxygenase, partial [Pseudomonadota bacterium]